MTSGATKQGFVSQLCLTLHQGSSFPILLSWLLYYSSLDCGDRCLTCTVMTSAWLARTTSQTMTGLCSAPSTLSPKRLSCIYVYCASLCFAFLCQWRTCAPPCANTITGVMPGLRSSLEHLCSMAFAISVPVRTGGAQWCKWCPRPEGLPISRKHTPRSWCKNTQWRAAPSPSSTSPSGLPSGRTCCCIWDWARGGWACWHSMTSACLPCPGETVQETREVWQEKAQITLHEPLSLWSTMTCVTL